MSLEKISVRSVTDGKNLKAYRKTENVYAYNPDTNRREFIQQMVSYHWPNGEALNTKNGINFTSLSGREYTLAS